jgi:hypothetical protein
MENLADRWHPAQSFRYRAFPLRIIGFVGIFVRHEDKKIDLSKT